MSLKLFTYIALFIIFSHWCTQHTIDVCACVWMWLPLEKRCSSKQMRAKRLSSNQDILFGGCFWMALWRLVFVALVVCVDFFRVEPLHHQHPSTTHNCITTWQVQVPQMLLLLPTCKEERRRRRRRTRRKPEQHVVERPPKPPFQPF